jgi:hypothetical protein
MAMSMAKTNYFLEDFARACKQNTMWDTVNKLTAYKKKTQAGITTLKLGDGTETMEIESIFNSLAEALIVTSDYSVDDTQRQLKITRYCKECEDIVAAPSTKQTEVEQAIKELDEKSSNSDGCIPALFVKKVSHVFALILTMLFNAILLYSKVPSAFKEALVTPLYKMKGPRNIAKSYRPFVKSDNESV